MVARTNQAPTLRIRTVQAHVPREGVSTLLVDGCARAADGTVGRASAPAVPSLRPDAASARRLLLFAKEPAPGRVKTRMIAPGGLTAGQAASLHAALVADLSGRLRAGCWELILMWSLPERGDPPGDLTPVGVPWRRQHGSDLGERLFRGLEWAASGAGCVAAIGSDQPVLDTARVEAAFDLLACAHDVVLGPARDGGYYLIALRREALHRRLFDGVAWGTPAVLRETLSRCCGLGLEVGLLPEEEDLDTIDDLARFASALERRPELRLLCPRTADLVRSWSAWASGTESRV